MLWTHAEVDRETPLFEGAIDLGKARRAHPFELIAKRRASVVAHPFHRALVFAAVHTRAQHVLVPQPPVARFGRGRRSQHLFRVNEQPPGPQRLEDPLE